MLKKTKSILDELAELSIAKSDNIHVTESRALNIIHSCINLLEHLHKHYDSEIANDLEKRFLNSIRSRDSSKFSRGIGKVKK